MKEFIKNNKKNDITFLITLGVLVIISIFRFYDEEMKYHEAPWSILQNLTINKLAIVALVGSMFVFFFICIIKSKKEDKKTMYYLCTFLTVFMVPMFSTYEYLGTMDMYAWIVMFLITICFVLGKVVWLSIPLSFLMLLISPMSAFNCGILVIILSFYKMINESKKSYILLCLFNIVVEIGAVVISIYKYGLHTDPQYILSMNKFLVFGFMLLPYLLIAGVFFVGLIKKSVGKDIATWLCFVVGAVPSIVVNVYIGDYTRAILYTFIYFIVGVMCFIARQDSTVIEQMNKTKEVVKCWVPIPAVLVAYPLLFITFWIAGPIVLFTEVFTG